MTGRAPSGRALAVPAEPSSTVSALTGFDPSRLHGLNSVIGFGKYRGLTVAAVIKFNPRYLAWAVKNVAGFDLDAEARKIGQRAINAEREFGMNQQNAWAYGYGLEAKEARRRHDRRMIEIEHRERAIATEARRAETVKQGSVHEGAGPKDIAQ